MSFKYKTQTNEDEDDAHQEPIYKENRAKSVFHTPHVKFDYVHPTHPILKDTICRRCCRSCTPWRIGLIALLVVLIASVVTVLLISRLKFHTMEELSQHLEPSPHSEPKKLVKHKQPHILLILADDLGYHDVGWHGSEIKTPHLDDLANRGVKLENYYVQQVCTPSRSQLLSGRYQIYTGLQHLSIHPSVPNGLPLTDKTLASTLRDAGYSTHQVGKWHLGFYKEDYMPNNRGFDTAFGYLLGAEDYFNHTRCNGQSGCGLDFRRNKDVVRDMTGKYSAHIFAQEAVDIINDNQNEKPMFLYLAMQSVHHPLQVPEEYVKPYEHIQDQSRRVYAAMTSCLDEAIKNVTSALIDASMYENTVIIFSTDNGGQTIMGGNNWPLRGRKATLWEGGIRAAGFVHSPLIKNPGSTSTELMHISDWYPTLANLGKAKTKELKLDGYDLWKTISKGKDSPRLELLHNIDPLNVTLDLPRYPHEFDTRVQAGIRHGDWKLLTGNPGDSKHYPVPNSGDTIPITIDGDNPSVHLYNIADDHEELHDLSTSRLDIVNLLLDRLQYYNSTAVPCRYPNPDPQSSPSLHGGVWGPWM